MGIDAATAARWDFNYRASPTCRKFHHCDARARCIIGPIGSGKSSAIIAGEVMWRGMRQQPDPQGRRRTRVVMIRNTYNELTTTTLKTFREWWGYAVTTYRSDKPLSANIRIPLNDGTVMECEVIFLAMDKPEDVGKLRSLELTWGYVNEGSEIVDYEIFDALLERVGRYPKKWTDGDGRKCGGPTWYGACIDTNAPDDEHWIYRKFEVERPEGFVMFHQPPAVLLAAGPTPENPVWEANKGQRPGVPAAENVENIPVGWSYYLNQLPGKSYEKVRVMLCGEYGTDNFILVGSLSEIGKANSLYHWRYGDKGEFLAWAGIVKVAQSNLVDDERFRIFVSGDTEVSGGQPAAMFVCNTGDDGYVVRPLVKETMPAPSLTVGAPSDSSDIRYSVWFQTWVDEFGQESPTSDASSVFYASQDGICQINPDTDYQYHVSVLTDKFLTKEQWSALAPETCLMEEYDGALFAWFTPSDREPVALIFDMKEQAAALTTHDEHATSAFYDCVDDALYYVRSV